MLANWTERNGAFITWILTPTPSPTSSSWINHRIHSQYKKCNFSGKVWRLAGVISNRVNFGYSFDNICAYITQGIQFFKFLCHYITQILFSCSFNCSLCITLSDSWQSLLHVLWNMRHNQTCTGFPRFVILWLAQEYSKMLTWDNLPLVSYNMLLSRGNVLVR